MKTFYQKLITTSGVFQSTFVIGGNILATGISAIALIIFSRILGPEQFGLFSVGFALVLILTRVNELGLNTAILKYSTPIITSETQNDIFSIIFRYKIIATGIIGGVGVISAQFIANLLNIPDTTIVYLSFTVGLATVYYELLLSILQSLHLFSQSVLANVIQALGKLLLAFTLLFVTQVHTSLVFALYIVAPFIPVLLYKLFLPNSFKINLSTQNVKLKAKILKLTRHSAIALITAGIVENIDVLFLQKYLTTYEAGLFAGVSRISLAFALVAYSLGNVLFPRVARYKTKEHLKTFIKKAWLVLLGSSIACLLFLPFAQYVLIYTIGWEYISGLPILILLSIASFIAVASTPFMALFYSFDADWYFSISGIGQLIIVLIGNYFFVPVFGLDAAAWTRIASRLFLLLFSITMGVIFYKKTYENPANKI